jgi:TPR repeat protein
MCSMLTGDDPTLSGDGSLQLAQARQAILDGRYLDVVKLLEEACYLENSEAMWELGNAYIGQRYGLSDNRINEQSTILFLRAHNLGYDRATVELLSTGELHNPIPRAQSLAKTTKDSYVKAELYYNEYLRTEDRHQDLELARDYYIQASLSGCIEADHVIAEHTNWERHPYYLQALQNSAKYGHPPSQNAMGQALDPDLPSRSLDSIKKNSNKALEWYCKAAAQGYHKALEAPLNNHFLCHDSPYYDVGSAAETIASALWAYGRFDQQLAYLDDELTEDQNLALDPSFVYIFKIFTCRVYRRFAVQVRVAKPANDLGREMWIYGRLLQHDKRYFRCYRRGTVNLHERTAEHYLKIVGDGLADCMTLYTDSNDRARKAVVQWLLVRKCHPVISRCVDRGVVLIIAKMIYSWRSYPKVWRLDVPD